MNRLSRFVAKRSLLVASLTLVTAAMIFVLASQWLFHSGPRNETADIPDVVLRDHYSSQIQPIFTARCIACHSCYNSPCQLDLTSYEGARRGASHIDVYDFPKLESRPPTRIGVDAQSEEEWRKKGFFTVLNPEKPGPSIIVELIRPSSPSRQKSYASEESRVCIDQASPNHLKAFYDANPGGRMPFGLPALSDQEFQKISTWVRDGAIGPSREAQQALSEPTSKEGRKIIKSWEDDFNRKDFKARLTARYIYEHLFAARITIEGLPGEVYRLVRADKQEGAFRELPSTRPYDDLGRKFSYRLQRYSAPLVAKTNLHYHLDQKKRERWKELFYDRQWEEGEDKFPAYGPSGANAFATFKRIPADSRYRFLLDNAYYHISTFIKGPVCRGQTALNVINDHFWVMFVDPSVDLMARDSKLYAKMAPTMSPPASAEDEITLFKNFREGYWQALQHKYAAYKKANTEFGPQTIWDGDKTNPDALLTVYRHFDSAQVLKGAWGETPETVWVMDYQVFEDIYYNLVAGYNVFGPLIHQLNTRLYMDLSRISSEDMFLNHLPSDARANLRAGWYRDTPEKEQSLAQSFVEILGQDVKTLSNRKYPYLGSELRSSSERTHTENSQEAKKAFLARVFTERFTPEVRGTPDFINRDKDASLGWFAGLNVENKKRDQLKKLTALPAAKAEFVNHMPDTSLLRVRGSLKDEVYTLVRNKAHLNVSLILFEDERRETKRDTLNIIPGFATTYPNLYLDVEAGDLDEMVESLVRAEKKSDWENWKKRYAIDRQGPRFWEIHDWFNQQNLTSNPNDPGFLDLNRYQ